MTNNDSYDPATGSYVNGSVSAYEIAADGDLTEVAAGSPDEAVVHPEDAVELRRRGRADPAELVSLSPTEQRELRARGAGLLLR